jgi:pSer/pThr/pTyr-binding forkhead associated (FHA) protein
MDLKLVNVDGSECYLIDRQSVVIGRECSNDIAIERELLSRRHAKLSLVEGSWLLEDMGSTNGTFVNNRKINQPTQVKVGDVLKFGQSAFYLQSNADGAQTIVAARLPKNTTVTGGSITIEDESNSDRTSFQQSYQLPVGWDDSGSVQQNPGYAKEAIDKIIKKTIISKGLKPDAVLLFFVPSQRPLVYGISAKSAKIYWLIGRGSEAKLRIDDPSISQTHAKVIYDNGDWRVEDVGSTNGIRVDEKVCSRMFLKDEMVVSLGRVDMVFRKLN